ncbi:MAG TPA: phosphopantetheine-binding protein [Smithellaceae bacterium]|nr:phosphopantetheine-binding protein [Smithellaceae bacterium]HRS82227.1 phosphopantetheine-binding protein [Smithellaceae bacterium]HRV45651.1 phosphopantetheine-binding protein [Smithellaceae bacterium]
MPADNVMKAIHRRVAEIIIDELKLEDLTPDTFNPDMDLVDELGIDSMDLATIALVLQDEYKIVIDEDDYPRLKTIRLICDYIEEKIATRH